MNVKSTRRTIMFPLHQWLRERATVLRYTYFAHPVEA